LFILIKWKRARSHREEEEDAPKTEIATGRRQPTRLARIRDPSRCPRRSPASQVAQTTGLMVRTALVTHGYADAEFEKQTCHDLSKKDHDYYFGSYSSFYIHEEMLKDAHRTRTY
jgi:hypothetical protein